ncbi:MAG: DEAD/DEAH box helicase [Spirochaetota bacterium]
MQSGLPAEVVHAPAVPGRAEVVHARAEWETRWRVVLLAGTHFRRRLVVSLGRQYRRRDGTYGHIEPLRPGDPVHVPPGDPRELVERIALLGGSVPMVALAEQLVRVPLPAFAGSPNTPSGAHRTPVSFVRPEYYEVSLRPRAWDTGWWSGPPVHDSSPAEAMLEATVVAKGPEGRVTVPPTAYGDFDEGLGSVIASFAEIGVVLVDDDRSPLPALRAVMGALGSVTPESIVDLNRLAERHPASLVVRCPKRVRIEPVAAEPRFVLSVEEQELHLRLELGRPPADAQRDDDVAADDGAVRPVPDEWVVRPTHYEWPQDAIAAGCRAMGEQSLWPETWSGLDLAEEQYLWRWSRRTKRADVHLLRTARSLHEQGFVVYVATPRGLKRVRANRTLAVRVDTGLSWFAPVVTDGERALDAGQLREIAERSALERGQELLLYGRAGVERVKRLLSIQPEDPCARVATVDIATCADLAELADEVAADLEPVRALAAELVSGTSSRVPRVPQGLRARLRQYQRDGFGWLTALARHGLSGCLADDMGLGKTIQALALMLHLKETPVPAENTHGSEQVDDRLRGAFLVVAPVSTLGNWRREAERFAPGLSTHAHHGANRETEATTLVARDVIVTSYATAMRDAELLSRVRWRLIVLDEAQAIKNPYARTTGRLKSIGSDFRLCLTGTPVENVSTDLWSIMDFLIPGLLGSLSSFTHRFPKRNVRSTPEASRRLERLRRIVSPFVLRRTKEAVAPELPPRIETRLACEMGGRQARFYETLRTYHEAAVRRAIASGDIREIGAAVFTGLLRLRQAAIYPPSADPLGRDVPSVKEAELMVRLEEIVQEGNRALVFSQFVSALSRFRDCSVDRGIRTLYLDGGTRHRDCLIEQFQTSDAAGVFFISLRAGGTGINLTAADYVFVCDPWWNPQVERQAVDRAHRIGRDRPVVVTRLIAAGTVEEKVLELQDQKRSLAADLISENPGGIDLRAADELLRLFEKV